MPLNLLLSLKNKTVKKMDKNSRTLPMITGRNFISPNTKRIKLIIMQTIPIKTFFIKQPSLKTGYFTYQRMRGGTSVYVLIRRYTAKTFHILRGRVQFCAGELIFLIERWRHAHSNQKPQQLPL